MKFNQRLFPPSEIPIVLLYKKIEKQNSLDNKVMEKLVECVTVGQLIKNDFYTLARYFQNRIKAKDTKSNDINNAEQENLIENNSFYYNTKNPTTKFNGLISI